jgi:tetratricopeptide (TPR) repeat protein
MFRWVMVFFVLLCITTCIAQSLREEDSLPDPTPGAKTPPARTITPRSIPAVDSRISVLRLTVPGKARKLYAKAAKLFLKRSFLDAQQNLDQALALHPAFPEALTLQGVIELNLHHLPAAEQNYESAIQVDPSFLPPYLALADLYNAQFRFDDALATIEGAPSEAPRTWAGQYETAWALIGKKQYDRALAITDDALRRHPDPASLLHLARAHALAGLKNFPHAIREMQNYLRSHTSGENTVQDRNFLQQMQAASGE